MTVGVGVGVGNASASDGVLALPRSWPTSKLLSGSYQVATRSFSRSSAWPLWADQKLRVLMLTLMLLRRLLLPLLLLLR